MHRELTQLKNNQSRTVIFTSIVALLGSLGSSVMPVLAQGKEWRQAAKEQACLLAVVLLAYTGIVFVQNTLAYYLSIYVSTCEDVSWGIHTC